MHVQPRKRGRVTEAPCATQRFPIIRRADKHSRLPKVGVEPPAGCRGSYVEYVGRHN
jgi:hypothetical protein